MQKLFHRRRIKIFSARWQRRALFLLGGAGVGLVAVALAYLSDLAQAQFRVILGIANYAPLALTPLGFALSAYLTKRYFPNCQGSGIPQAIAARKFTDRSRRLGLVSGRIAIGKVLLTLMGLLVGGSIGREGPTVQVGASLMFMAGRLSPRHQPGLILAGAAAGVAAAFNAPLAGIVFGIEEMSRSFELQTSGLVLGTVIAAGLVSQSILGDYTYFGSTPAALNAGLDWLAVPIVGLAGGLLGGLFSRIVIAAARGFPGSIGRAIKRYPIWFAAICGLLAAICGLASGGTTYGTGYEEVRSMLEGGAGPGWSFGFLKMGATAFSAISGIPGGIFSPSIAVGAGLGMDVAWLIPNAPLDAVILLGMVAYFTGVVQAPITGFVIVSELTDNHAMMMPLMGAAIIAYAVSRAICREGIYHALAQIYLQRDRDGTARG